MPVPSIASHEGHCSTSARHAHGGMARRALHLGIAGCLITLLAAGAIADGPPAGAVLEPTVPGTPGIDPTDSASDGSSQRTGTEVTPIFAPIPFRNSQLGWGLMLMAGAIHRFDPDTTFKPSTGAVAGFYTENESWGLMVIEAARLAGDRWRLRGLASHVDVRYDFYGIGEDAGDAGRRLALRQTMDFAVGSALRRVVPGFYGGASLLWIRSDVALQEDLGLTVPPPPKDFGATQLMAPGLVAELDTRDDDYWPSRGSMATGSASFFSLGLGSAREFQRYLAGYSWYLPLRGDALVLALNASAAGSAGDVPFWAIPSVGAGRYGLRGYTQGRYRDRLVTTLQGELREHRAGRWGATVFGGIAQVAPAFDELRNAQVLPAAGLGLRFQLTREYPMHLRADYAWGKNESLFYFSVGEAF